MLATSLHRAKNREIVSRITRHTHTCEDGTELIRVHFGCQGAPRGLLLIPPLIGGSYLQFGRIFDFTVRNGWEVVSFNYRGHPKSGGRFDVDSAFRDTEEIAMSLRATRGLPLIGVGLCFGAAPLHFAAARNPSLFDALVFINGIRDLWDSSSPLEAARIFWSARKNLQKPRTTGLLTVVLDELFPDIDKDLDHFGVLPYQRVDGIRTARQYFFHRRTRQLQPISTPALVCYGSEDRLLQLDNEERRKVYLGTFAQRFANLTTVRMPSGHYMDGIEERVGSEMLHFLEAVLPEQWAWGARMPVPSAQAGEGSHITSTVATNDDDGYHRLAREIMAI